MVKTALLTWNHENASTSADPCGLSLCNRSTTKILSSGVRNLALSNEGGKTSAAKSPTATVMSPSTMNNHRQPFSGIEVPGRCPLPPSLLRPVASSPPKLSTFIRIHQISPVCSPNSPHPIPPPATPKNSGNSRARQTRTRIDQPQPQCHLAPFITHRQV